MHAAHNVAVHSQEAMLAGTVLLEPLGQRLLSKERVVGKKKWEKNGN